MTAMCSNTTCSIVVLAMLLVGVSCQKNDTRAGKSHHKYIPPIQGRSGKTLPEQLKLDHVEDVYWLSTREYDDYSRSLIYNTMESETDIAEASIKKLIRNSDSITIHISEDYNTFNHFTFDDKPFLHQASDLFRLSTAVEIWPVGPPNLLMREYVSFQPSGIRMTFTNSEEAYIFDSCTPPQWARITIDIEFLLLYKHRFKDLFAK